MMKRKAMAITLTAAMLAGLTAVPTWAEDAAADEGKVLNIYCWNEEFKSRLTDHYPGYEEVDGTHGKIGDVDVVWNITPSDDNAYQNNLDETLLKQADAAADDKIDLFLVEADYTNLLDDEVSDILKVSEGRWQIEECFRIMKTDFSARPVYLRDENRIKAHFLICFLALMIYRFLERKLYLQERMAMRCPLV